MMWQEIEPGMKSARETNILTLKKYLLYMGFESRTFTLSFLRSTDSPMAAEIHSVAMGEFPKWLTSRNLRKFK